MGKTSGTNDAIGFLREDLGDEERSVGVGGVGAEEEGGFVTIGVQDFSVLEPDEESVVVGDELGFGAIEELLLVIEVS